MEVSGSNKADVEMTNEQAGSKREATSGKQ